MKAFACAFLLASAILTHSAQAQQTQATPGTAPAASTPASGANTTVAPATQPLAVSAIVEKELISQNGGNLGEIEQVVEKAADKKQYLVVSHGGLLGFFSEEYVVPVDQVVVDGDKVIARTMTEEQIKSAEEFNDSNSAFKALDSNQTISLALK